MKVIDIKSIIIGILITLLFLAVYGFRSETDELGHLVVKSITVEDDRGVIMGYLGNGYMQTYNQFGEPTLFVGTGKDGGGYLRAYNGNGDESAYVGTGRMGGDISEPTIMMERKHLILVLGLIILANYVSMIKKEKHVHT